MTSRCCSSTQGLYFFFFNDTATTEIYTLSLHDALPICWPLFIWGFCLSTVLLWHDTFTINSLSHLFGTRRYETTDTSKNNWLLALLTLGEGWHNNHHHFMASARQGFFWWEVDITYYTLKMLSWFGIV